MTDLEILKKYFGYDSYRDGQEMLISSILSGQDVLGIMPTGAGKSICYQVPALVMDGITIVISPLISLMKDQVSSLNQAGIHAAYINSSLTERQIATALSNAKNGQYKIIYVAPERLETTLFLEFAMNSPIAMVTIDEAHCISQWGQDFRPSYLKIVTFIKQLPIRPVVSAFTATATKTVKDDIVCILGLKDPKVLLTGFDRKNLYFDVQTPRKKEEVLLQYIDKHREESGIIYCATRKNVDKIHELLLSRGLPVTKYHAGLSNGERQTNQDAFIYDTKPIIVATNAFGMGIDKSNVRYILHYNMPQSIENYYQEAGRAGRDGEPAECILLYSPQDVVVNQFLIHSSEQNQELSSDDLAVIQQRDEERLRQMSYYCMTKNCLREYILNYFGDFGNGSCGNCSSCLTKFEQIDVTDICKDIVYCIMESGQRYGLNVIVGTLRGERKAKLTSYGVDKLLSYGKRSELSEGRLKQIVHYMLMEQYLHVTKDKYALLKLNSGTKEIVEGSKEIIMRCSPEVESASSTRGSGKQRKSDILTSKGLDLFDQLRELRLTIAKEENMPPYIIFSDKSLVDMCVKLPRNKQEILQVSGVGENKYERYGERFIECILTCTDGLNESYSYDTEVVLQEQCPSELSGRVKKKKSEFCLTKEMANQLIYSQNSLLGELVNQMNELRDEKSMKRISGVSIMRQLEKEQIIKEQQYQTVILDKGNAIGITAEIRMSKIGREYSVLRFSEEAQRFIVDNLLGNWGDILTIES